jgi:hypothetical protein
LKICAIAAGATGTSTNLFPLIPAVVRKTMRVEIQAQFSYLRKDKERLRLLFHKKVDIIQPQEAATRKKGNSEQARDHRASIYGNWELVGTL